MQSHGGVAPVGESARLAAGAVLSGPAGGVAAARHCVAPGRAPPDHLRHGRHQHRHRAPAGRRAAAHGREARGYRARGAAEPRHPHAGRRRRLDRPGGRGGILHVGPESAGADPGPACYGKGGTAATVTDANLVLGFLDPANFLGGRIPLDAAAAPGGGGRRGARARHRRLVAAEGIAQVVNTNMAEGISIVSVRRGVDPRRFTLVAFGGRRRPARDRGGAPARDPPGGGPQRGRRALGVGDAGHRPALRAGALARQRGLAADAGRPAPHLRGHGGGGARAAGPLRRARRVRRALDMRYGEQIFEIPVGLDGVDLGARGCSSTRSSRASTAATRSSTPTARRGRKSSSSTRGWPWSGSCPPCAPAGARPTPRAACARPPARVARRLGGGARLPARRAAARPLLKGPAIFESATTTVLARDGERVTVTPHGWLDIALG